MWKMKDLDNQCQKCINLRCGHVRMNGDNSYYCSKVICFWKNKETDCKYYEGEEEIDD